MVSREVSDHLGLTAVRKCCRDPRYALVWRKGEVELYPGRRIWVVYGRSKKSMEGLVAVVNRAGMSEFIPT